MSEQHLNTYLNDHLALLVGEAELAERCRSSNADTELGGFLERLIADLREERRLLHEMLELLGASPDRLKQGAAWLAEKAGRLKPNNALLKYSELSRLIELEALAAAAHAILWSRSTACQ